MQNKIMVSVCCLAYNHEKYIRECLEGFVRQKTNFQFEVLVHDDASTDKTADIIREYEAKYPDIIKPVYQTKNQWSQKNGPFRCFLYPRVKGKYIAWCEGDDYWCDEHKLQKQFDIMEANEDCCSCFHSSKIINENGEDLHQTIPAFKVKGKKYSSYDWLRLFMIKPRLVQLSSMFVKTTVWDIYEKGIPEYFSTSPVGDRAIFMLCASKGNVFYIDQIMSAYRYCTSGSWSESFSKYTPEQKKSFRDRSILCLKQFDEYTEYRYTDLVELGIKDHPFREALEKHDYKKVLAKEYRPLFRALPVSHQIYYRFFGTFPFMEKLYRKMKDRH